VTVGFAFSGGGNLGPVQAGAVLALLEAGIEPGVLVGTSVGALNAVFLCTRPGLEGASALDASAVADRLRMVLVRLARQLRLNDPADPSMGLYAALATLADHGDMPIGELARVERLPSSGATRFADQIEEAGLAVRRRSVQDRRSVFLAATAEGRGLGDTHRALGNAWLAQRLERPERAATWGAGRGYGRARRPLGRR
jgi:DNA-binding MarR family transcriptional regulator